MKCLHSIRETAIAELTKIVPIDFVRRRIRWP
jgi:hypothetical protein